MSNNTVLNQCLCNFVNNNTALNQGSCNFMSGNTALNQSSCNFMNNNEALNQASPIFTISAPFNQFLSAVGISFNQAPSAHNPGMKSPDCPPMPSLQVPNEEVWNLYFATCFD